MFELGYACRANIPYIAIGRNETVMASTPLRQYLTIGEFLALDELVNYWRTQA